jgi:predicted ATP-grasp superfamily ATP-dependent carboligase
MAARIHSLALAWVGRAQELRAELARLEAEHFEIEFRIENLHRQLEGAEAAVARMRSASPWSEGVG